jgi:hypothetical protein
VSRARTERIAADRAAAAAMLEQADRHLASARAPGVDEESAYGLCYQAALKAHIAVLLARGLRVTSGAGGHVVILQEGGAGLALPEDVRARLQRMRRTRHQVFYELSEVSEREVVRAFEDAATVLAAARREAGDG